MLLCYADTHDRLVFFQNQNELWSLIYRSVNISLGTKIERSLLTLLVHGCDTYSLLGVGTGKGHRSRKRL